ncbi:MAG: TIGR04086 family membrane protein [Oscillospiraceae bacterium]|nr:TIGR04086 family membrane protein [Oscillospiraceae bacterium]
MELGKGGALPGKIGRAALVWLASSLVFSLLAALLISRTSVGAARIPLVSAAVLLLSSFLSALMLGLGGRRRWMSGVLYGMTLAVITLMIGFLIKSDQMSVYGLLRVLGCCFVGGLCGVLISGREKTKRYKSRFAFAQKKR